MADTNPNPPHINTGQTTTVSSGGDEGDDVEAHRCFWHTLKTNYLDNPDDDVLYAIVDKEQGINPLLQLTQCETVRISVRKQINALA